MTLPGRMDKEMENEMWSTRENNPRDWANISYQRGSLSKFVKINS